jgi:Kef-type K+ transport system membrane component KefB
MRRVFILALLLGGMQLLIPLGERGYGGQWLLTFGFLILAADTVGGLVIAFRLPRIVGYLIAGVLFGPSVLGTVSSQAIEQLAPVSALAIALIAFLAGAELRWSELREHGVMILKILAVEMSLTLVAVTALLFALRERVPFLSGTDTGAAVGLSLLFAAIAVVHSPAVTMALLTETKARGPVARTTLGVVLVSDVAVILLFSGVLSLARALVPPAAGGAAGVSLGALVWEIAGALVVGGVFGAGVALYLRFVRRELFLFAIVVAFLGAEIARLAHVEALLMLLTAGFVAENTSPREAGVALRHAMERSAAPVFVVFFALAGASMALAQLPALWTLVIPIVIARLLAIWGGTWLGARWGHASPPERRYVWLGLVSQAGVAIGLATIVAEAYPERGPQIQTLFLAVMAINQTLGPILFRHALDRSGEIVASEEEQEHEPSLAPPDTSPA